MYIYIYIYINTIYLSQASNIDTNHQRSSLHSPSKHDTSKINK